MTHAPLLAAAPFELAGECNAALSALLWAGAGVIIARIRPPVSAAALNLGKNVAATVLFVGALWIVSGSPVPTGLDMNAMLVFAASGFLGLALCDTLLMRSLLDIGPQRMSVVFLTVPVLTTLAAALPPFNEAPPWQAWLGILVCLGGILLAIRRRTVHTIENERFRRGVRNAFYAAIFQTASVLLARYGLNVQSAPILDSAVVRMGAGTVGLILIGGFAGRAGAWFKELTRKDVALMLFTASFFGTFLGILTNQYGLMWSKHAGVAMTLNSLMPIYLLPLSVLFLREQFGRREVVATLIAVAGVALMMMGS